MSGRVSRAFARASREGRAALVVFVEAGDPSLEVTEFLLPALAEAGADVLTLGVPFSYPIADGPAIQRASERALASGARLGAVLDLVGRARGAGVDVPVVLFGRAFWDRLIDWQFLVDEGTISPSDLGLVTYAETAAEAWQAILDFYSRPRGS